MKVLLLCDRESAGDIHLRDAIKNLLDGAGHDVTAVTLSREDIKPCMGCAGCWVKTPGRCVITRDGANGIAESLIRSDAVVLLSKITFGGFSADVKSFLDRSVQNVSYGFDKFSEIILKYHRERMAVITNKVWNEFEYYRGKEKRVDDFELIAFKI